MTQLVISGNRVLAHGEGFVSMENDTVLSTKTGTVYQNAAVAECEALPADIDTVGYEYHTGVFVPAAPFGAGSSGTLLISGGCSVPQSSTVEINTLLRASLDVSAPAGSAVTAACGGTVLTADESAGHWHFYLTSYGTWTVTATQGSHIKSAALTVDAVKPYALSIDYDVETSTTPQSGASYTSGLAGLSWAALSTYARAIAKNGDITAATAAVYINDNESYHKISLGDSSAVTVGGISYNAQIIGFNHDAVANSAAYGAANAGITFQLDKCYHTAYAKTDTNTWKTTALRTTVNSTIYSALPDELKSAIVTVNKLSQSHTSLSNLDTTADNMFILSAFEVFGSTTRGNTTADGTIYPFYQAGNSKIKYIGGTSTACVHYLRTIYKGDTDRFFTTVTAAGAEGYLRLTQTGYLAPAFCI